MMSRIWERRRSLTGRRQLAPFLLGREEAWRRRDVYAEEERGDIPHPMSSAITQMMFGLRGASPVAASAVPTTPTVIEAITDNRRNCETFVIFGENLKSPSSRSVYHITCSSPQKWRS
jgi:hypothetical protein